MAPRIVSVIPVARSGHVATRVGYTAAMRAFDRALDVEKPETRDRLEAMTLDLMFLLDEVRLEVQRRHGGDAPQTCAAHDRRRPDYCPVCAFIEMKSHTGTHCRATNKGTRRR